MADGIQLASYGLKKAAYDYVPDTNEALIDSVKTLLANTVTVYYRAHGHHWNVQGEMFSQFHELFQEIYESVYEYVDPTAENIRKLNNSVSAPFRLIDFVALRSIQEGPDVGTDGEACAGDILMGLNQLVATLNNVMALATAANEQGLINFVGGFIDDMKKWIWQLASTTNTAVEQMPDTSYDAFAPMPTPLGTDNTVGTV
jgi:DNA-binding ferritin-like protein